MTQAQPEQHGGLDVMGTFNRLREAYFRYYDTPFGLADDRLSQERRELLDRDNGAYRLPLIELRPEYVTTSRTLPDSAAACGAIPELAEFAACGLIPAGRSLYLHQEQALSAGLSPGKNMIVTAGTGSGKTESFLLPVLASLLEESASWSSGPTAFQPWWRSSGTDFVSQREGESGRPRAVRALILYPMNALVDDQLMRMRRALDSDAARQWLDTNRRGHRFYFGRYTGATPVTGSRTTATALERLRDVLRATEQRGIRAAEVANETGNDDVRYFVPRLDGAEMRSRWDMADAPPDVLVTNYSMLNVMLLRERDEHFFDSTRAWLDSSPSHRFTLVVDELHMYRGTAGTEVAYLLRNLKQRLGLNERPNQLRVLAASASIDAERDQQYLEEFFGVDATSFEFVAGSLAVPGHRARWNAGSDGRHRRSGQAFRRGGHCPRGHGLTDTFRRAFLDPDEQGNEACHRQIVDPAGRADLSRSALDSDRERALIEAARRVGGITDGPRPQGPRALLLPQCAWRLGVQRSQTVRQLHGSNDPRPVGRLYSEPTTRCACGARVLELLYCQNCGDVHAGWLHAGGRPTTESGEYAAASRCARARQTARPGSARAHREQLPRLLAEFSGRSRLPLDHHSWTRDSNRVAVFLPPQ